VDLYDPFDYDTQRNVFYNEVKRGVLETFPLEYKDVRIDLEDVDYTGDERVSIQKQKEAILNNRSINRSLRGTMVLSNPITGEELERKVVTLLSVPIMTDRGTYIQNGNEIGSIRQARLRSGPYTRRKANGQLETQFNVRQGTGGAFRVNFEPSNGQYRFYVKGSNIHLYSLLKDLGYDDATLEQSWGSELLEMNKSKYDRRALSSAYKKLVSPYKQDRQATTDQMKEAIIEALNSAQVERRIMERHLPSLRDKVKSASWREAEYVDMEKMAAFSVRELEQIAQFLNSSVGSAISLEGTREELETGILRVVGGDYNAAEDVMRQIAEEGLKNVRSEYDYPTPNTLL
jgi:DNA-directed RNA polymerase beta subunit